MRAQNSCCHHDKQAYARHGPAVATLVVRAALKSWILESDRADCRVLTGTCMPALHSKIQLVNFAGPDCTRIRCLELWLKPSARVEICHRSNVGHSMQGCTVASSMLEY
ncbi:hypothetical protein ABBQ32_005473 [Trebouxia sp. C0010 RCD-2024]